MIILASKSEARHRLLTQAGVNFTTTAPDLVEPAIKPSLSHLDAKALAQSLSTHKSLSVKPHSPQTFVIGADQTLSLGTEILTKPKSRDAARLQLRQLRGRTHSLHSAISVSQNGNLVFETTERANLTMRHFSEAYLEHYLTTAGDDILHCVGSYQIEGLGLTLFSNIDGDHFTIQGLPMLPLLAFLRDVGELPQ